MRTDSNLRSTSEGPVPGARTVADPELEGGLTTALLGIADGGRTTTKTENGSRGGGGLRGDHGDGIPLLVGGHRRNEDQHMNRTKTGKRNEDQTKTGRRDRKVHGQSGGMKGGVEGPVLAPRQHADVRDAPGLIRMVAIQEGGVAEAAPAKQCRPSGPGIVTR